MTYNKNNIDKNKNKKERIKALNKQKKMLLNIPREIFYLNELIIISNKYYL
jgi:hypothetical protein